MWCRDNEVSKYFRWDSKDQIDLPSYYYDNICLGTDTRDNLWDCDSKDVDEVVLICK